MKNRSTWQAFLATRASTRLEKTQCEGTAYTVGMTGQYRNIVSSTDNSLAIQ